jgi:hypothetical protein
MANTIKIKRRPSSGSAGKPSSLFNGELAFNENDNILYYGYGSGVGGAASSIEQIGGSGYFAHRGGINASGLWPVSVTGNAGTVTNGVYTTGTQTIGGQKTFSSSPIVSGNLAGQLIFQSANSINGGHIIFDGVNLGAESSYIKSSTSAMDITHATKIQLNSPLEVIAANTSTNNVGYFAVFDSNPASSLTTLKSVSKSDVLDDIGGASSGISMTAGSGLVGGGNLTQSRTFDIGQGDGISVSADSIAVNNTVVRTTGTQDIVGAKSFYESSNTVPIFSTASDVISVKAPNTSDQTYYFLGLNGGGSPPSSTSADRSLVSRSASQVKSDLSLNNVENTALSSVTFTAGSGLAGGGTLAASRSFDIGQGDGITVSADSIAVNSTVVRTTGTQSIGGTKTFSSQSFFSDYANFSSGINVSAGISYLNGITQIQSASTASAATHIPVFITSPAAGTQTIFTRTPSELKTDIGLSNVTNDAQIKKLASTSGGFVPTWNGTTGDALNIGYSVETTLTGGAGALPRADAVKTYVDNMIVSGIATNDAMIFKGAIDCSTNPNYPAADRGWTYKVSVAGKIGGASGPVVEVNDTLICNTDSTSAGTHAAVGSNWTILQTNIVDSSILVTGPTSATSGNVVMFDGSTGKIIKDGGFLASNIARLDVSQTFSSSTVNTFGVLNAGYQVTADPAFNIYDDGDTLNFQVLSGGSVTVGTWNASTIAANKGGTGQTSYAIGDLLYANTTSSLAKLADVATGNALLAGGVNTAPSWGKIGLTTHVSGTLPVANGGTNQTSFTDGQLLIGNSTGNTLSKATLTEGTGIDITNGAGSITITHEDTSTLTGAQGGNGIAAFTLDGMGHVTAVTTATYLTAGTVCAAIADCTLDGGSF